MPLTQPPPDGMEWGNLAQLGSFGVSALAFLISAVAFFGQRNDKQIDGLKKSQTDAVEKLEAAQCKATADLKADIRALRDDDARQFERIDTLDTEIASLKADVRHLPRTEDLHKIALEQARQGETLRGFGEVLAGVAGSVKAIERALIEREAKDR